VRYEYDGNDVYRLMLEEPDHGRVVALLIWVRNSLASAYRLILTTALNMTQSDPTHNLQHNIFRRQFNTVTVTYE